MVETEYLPSAAVVSNCSESGSAFAWGAGPPHGPAGTVDFAYKPYVKAEKPFNRLHVRQNLANFRHKCIELPETRHYMQPLVASLQVDRKSTRLNSSH